MPTRFDDVPLPFTSTKPLPTRHAQQSHHHHHHHSSNAAPSSSTQLPARSVSLKRGKTLTRPERHIAPVPLITPPAHHFSDSLDPNSPAGSAGGGPGSSCWNSNMWDWWVISSYITTWWAPPAVLKLFGIKERQSRQAWREKITLCWIAVLLGAVVGFATMGLQRALCPEGESSMLYRRLGTDDMTLSVSGQVINISTSLTQADVDFYQISRQMPGQDITNLFTRQLSDYPACTASARYATTPLCRSTANSGVKENGTLQACPLARLNDTTFGALRIQNTDLQEGYSWDQVAALDTYMVIDGLVLNMSPYISANPDAIPGDEVDAVIRQVLYNQSSSGKDATMFFHHSSTLKDAIPCMQSRYLAGRIDKITPGCFVASLFLYTSLAVILGVVFVRFAMACIFNWFISARLARPPTDLARNAISPAVMPEGANVSVHNKTGTAPWASGGSPTKKSKSKMNGKMGNNGLNSSSTTLVNGIAEPIINLTRIGAELFAICLVTCYSEGEDSVRGTVDSIASTNYSDARKLIWIVCDGMITGQGEKRSTPDICVSMLDADPRFGNPMPMGYIAVGSGAKRENRAMVYAGHYVTKNGHRTPTIIVVKCGMPNEAKDKKPGNRGKRDSQLILMNFFSRVTYNDRMSPLDYDMFRKVQTLMGVTPDYFEVVLMVDADTKIYPDSLKHLVNCMQADNAIMGVCGETRIANKRQSWVTAIQVYEYFISHHLVKAFESVFGGVTCLPGCFSMYRIKARKDSDTDWVPILVKPEIVREYSQSEVTTLHQKNLLLLGEDRFLSTIMLRTFPKRKNIFLPQARCRTVAPDTFSVLLSQRRRWINSTVHNLMELVRVRNLCGTFCFSMQFVVFMDLVGTVVLPVAISLTMALIVNSIITPPKSFQEAIPLMLLAAVLGLPAVLILITTRKVIYVAWMLCYLVALPIWNFILPVYSFWHFDDFSWGETRRVEGEIRSKGHDDKTAVFDGTTIPLRRWEDWEKSRLRKLKREEKRRRDFERQFGAGFHGDDSSDGHGGFGNGGLAAPGFGGGRAWARSEYESDAGSVFSGDEDIWGAEIGGYNEHNPAFPPPPIALPPQSLGTAGQTLGMDEMAAILDSGFEDHSYPSSNGTTQYRSQAAPPPFTHSNSDGPSNGGYTNTYTSSPLHRTAYTPPTPNHQWGDTDPLDHPHTPDFSFAPGSASGGGAGAGGMPHSADSISSSVESRVNHAKKRSGGAGVDRYGPLGPLADDDTGWGSGPGYRGKR